MASNNELILKTGEIFRLAARHNACLKALLEANGQTVDYDTLLMEVWGTQYRDTNTIASVISELRKLINCGDPNLKYISTVPKKGYRFNAFEQVSRYTTQQYAEKQLETGSASKLKPHPENNKAQGLAQPKAISSEQKNSSLLQLLNHKKQLISISLITAFTAVLFLAPSFSANFVTPSFSQKTLTFDRGIEYDFAISPDKSLLVYLNEQESQYTLMVKQLSTGEKQLVELGNNQRLTSFAFSRDGLSFAFVEHQGKQCQLFITRVAGNELIMEEKKLLDSCAEGGYLMSVTFAKDGNSLFYAKGDQLSSPFVIVKHDLTTGLIRNFTSPPTTGRGDYGTAISPNGNYIAFVRDLFWERSSIWVMNIQTGETRKLFSKPFLIDKISWRSDDELIFTKDGKLLSYSIAKQKFSALDELPFQLYMAEAIGDSVIMSKGNLFLSELSYLDLNTLALEERDKIDYYEHTPTAPQDDGSFYYISNRSNRNGIWHSTGKTNVLVSDSPELEHISTLADAGDCILATTPGKLFRIDKQTNEITILKEDLPNLENFTYSKDINKVLFSKEVNESWYLESLKLDTDQKELLGVSGYTGHFFKNDIYLTQFRKPGLWRYNPYTREKKLLIEEFETYSSGRWAVTSDYILLIRDTELKIWQNAPSYHLVKTLELKSNPKRINCSDSTCIFDRYTLGSTDIIELIEAK
ncbi:winged helix-turn-helix domain-containing protein [Pseudoalteromonas sp. XMcav11-Q]|uniref:winged helix-turn-helix domain-containing protein n=1 Tax=Pseudoalteromonas sp. XMcav11-Q TaxID=3136665 RepID=UPI0032C4406C